MPEPTPGHVAYAAYETCRKGMPVPPGLQDVLWRGLDASEQQCWEAAARAVRDDVLRLLAPLERRRWEAAAQAVRAVDTEEDTP